MTSAAGLRIVVGAVLAAVVAAALTAAGSATKATDPYALSELWLDPGDIAARDLRWGRGGEALAPSAAVDYQFEAIDAVGFSAGYDVADPQGRHWDVKTGDEAQPELIVSRLLWAVGYHQPIVYFMPEWRLKSGPVTKPLSGRFRLSSDHDGIADWSWSENPFKGTRQLKGLIVANLLVNNWDLKTSNNRVYSVPAATGAERWFVAQDLGASLGKTGWPVGSRHHLEGFESQRFVLGVDGERVQFDYHARHQELFEGISVADVVWISQLFSRITDRQWSDVFLAAAMPEDASVRYIRKFKSKIQEGLALGGHGTVK